MKYIYAQSQEYLIYYESVASALGLKCTADPCAHILPLPKVIGWHPSMKESNHRGFRTNNKGFTCESSYPPDKTVDIYVKPSEEKLRFYALNHQYYVMTIFDVIMITKMLMWKVPVVLTLTGDPTIDTFYEPLTLRTVPQHGQSRLLGEKFLDRYKETKLELPDISSITDTECQLIVPDDLNEPLEMTETVMNDKNVSLRLSKTDDMDSLPNVTVLITDVSQPELLECCINNTTYPHHLLKFLTVNCTYLSYESITMPMDLQTIMKTFNGIVIVVSSQYWYYPHSIYAKVKLLLDHKDKVIVGTNEVPYYHLVQTPRSYVRETDMPFLETSAIRSVSRLLNRRDYLLMPFNFNCINITPNEPSSNCSVTNNIYSLIDFGTQCSINKLYRSLYGRPCL